MFYLKTVYRTILFWKFRVGIVNILYLKWFVVVRQYVLLKNGLSYNLVLSTWLFLAAGAMGQHNFPVRNFWVTLVKLLRPEFSRIFEIFQNFGDVESSRFLLQRNIYGMSLEYLWNMTGTGDFKSNLPFTCWDNSIWESLHYTYFHHYYPNQDHNIITIVIVIITISIIIIFIVIES